MSTGHRNTTALFGFDPADGIPLTKHFFSVFIQKTGRGRPKPLMELLLREGAEFAIDYRLILPDGTTRYISSMGHPIFKSIR